jgi:hypothetical protein
MTMPKGTVNELCFAAEGMSGTAASTSLRRLGSLMDAAPSGRLFGAIATLSDMSVKATKALEDGSFAMQAGDDQTAAVKLARALTHMDDLATLAAAQKGAAEERPSFLKKAR